MLAISVWRLEGYVPASNPGDAVGGRVGACGGQGGVLDGRALGDRCAELQNSNVIVDDLTVVVGVDVQGSDGGGDATRVAVLSSG